VLLANNTMRKLASPLTVWAKRGNPIGRITVMGLNATDVTGSAVSVESWADAPITNLVLRNVALEFAGGGRAEQAVAPVRNPGVDVRSLPAWGLYARNVERLTLEDVRFSLVKDDFRPVLMADRVGRLDLDGFKFPRIEGVEQPLALIQVGVVKSSGEAERKTAR